MKRILFPFTGLFDRLDLKRRWWHRLAVVVFFLSFSSRDRNGGILCLVGVGGAAL